MRPEGFVSAVGQAQIRHGPLLSAFKRLSRASAALLAKAGSQAAYAAMA
jgi:hypothetical protein